MSCCGAVVLNTQKKLLVPASVCLAVCVCVCVTGHQSHLAASAGGSGHAARVNQGEYPGSSPETGETERRSSKKKEEGLMRWNGRRQSHLSCV